MTNNSDHIRKEALYKLDVAHWTSAHWRAVLVAGSGFLTDSYDNFVIGLMVTMIGYVYFPWNKNKVPDVDAGWVKAASSWGNLVGQFVFGIMGDIFGRKKIYGVELIILLIGALGCALAAPPARGIGFLGVLGFWRFVLGVGVGGDYPVSGVITAEFASANNRGTMIALVFAMQGVGIILGSLVAIIALAAFKNMILDDPLNLDYAWRIMAGFGMIPALCAVYYRLTIPETPRYAMHVERDAAKGAAAAQMFLGHDSGIVDEAALDMSISENSTVSHVVRGNPRKEYWSRFKAYFGKWENAKVLLATSMCWFLLDIGYYGTNLNTPTIIGAFGYAAPATATTFDKVWTAAVGTTVVNLAGNFPGYWFTVFFIDRWGRKPIQFMGFIVLTICFLLLGIFYNQLSQAPYLPAFVVLYCMAQFFFNFGPNQTTFIVPAEVFPTHVRSSAHGISAAAGKLGAILAAQAFDPIKAIQFSNGVSGIAVLLYIFAACCAGGLLFTFWIPETMGKTLEELSSHDDEVVNSERYKIVQVSQ